MPPSPKAARCLTLIASPAAATTLVVASVSARAAPGKSKEMLALLRLSYGRRNRGDRSENYLRTGVSHGSLKKGVRMKIGFIGLGIMGSRMAANLQKHGHALVVFNRTREKAEPLLAEGAKWADTPAALALQAEVIFTMLAHPDAVEEAALGKNGFLRRPGRDKMWVDCSTVNPSFSRKMAEEAKAQGVDFLGA